MVALSISFGNLSAQLSTLNLSSFDTSASGRFGAFMFFSNPAKGVDGSVYLYENWNNSVIIQTVDAKRLLIKNINLNLMRNTFEAKISQDSIFTFNFNNIDRFVINGKEYKNFYYDDDNRVYELLFDSENLSILKGYKIKYIEASINPMGNRPRDRYVQTYNYYVRRDGKISPITLKKNRILKLLKDDEKIAKIKEYVESNNLSYSNEDNVKKIMKYYDYMNSSVVNK